MLHLDSDWLLLLIIVLIGKNSLLSPPSKFWLKSITIVYCELCLLRASFLLLPIRMGEFSA